MEHRIQQLERKLVEQQLKLGAHEQANAALREDVKSLKEIKNGDRGEYRAGFEHCEAKKKKKTYALLGDADSRIVDLQHQQERLATKAELRLLSDQLDDLKTLVDRAAAGIHASGSPQAQDLMVFSPDRSLINFDETASSPAHSLTGHEARSETQPLQYHTTRISSPLPDVSNVETVPLLRNSLEDVPSAKSSVTERDPSPFVCISPPAATVQNVNEDQTAQMAKRVRFDLSAQRANSPPSDSGSEDPLAPNATLRKKLLSNKTIDIKAASEDSPLVTAKTTKPSRRKSAAAPKSLPSKPAAALKSLPSKPTADPKSSRGKPAGVLDQFKDGRLDTDSDDEDLMALPLQPQTPVSNSQDTEATIDLAERAIASLVEAAIDGAATGTRRSGRAPKPKDFGDVEVHGRKKKRARRS